MLSTVFTDVSNTQTAEEHSTFPQEVNFLIMSPILKSEMKLFSVRFKIVVVTKILPWHDLYQPLSTFTLAMEASISTCSSNCSFLLRSCTSWCSKSCFYLRSRCRAMRATMSASALMNDEDVVE